MERHDQQPWAARVPVRSRSRYCTSFVVGRSAAVSSAEYAEYQGVISSVSRVATRWARAFFNVLLVLIGTSNLILHLQFEYEPLGPSVSFSEYFAMGECFIQKREYAQSVDLLDDEMKLLNVLPHSPESTGQCYKGTHVWVKCPFTE